MFDSAPFMYAGSGATSVAADLPSPYRATIQIEFPQLMARFVLPYFKLPGWTGGIVGWVYIHASEFVFWSTRRDLLPGDHH